MQDFIFVFLGIFFIFFMTTAGSAVVFFFKGEISPKLNATILGFASGIMTSASVFSLLLPSITQAKILFGHWAFLPVFFGVIFGGIFLIFLDKRIPATTQTSSERRKARRLFWSVTLHNIPEGLAVGFAFGACARGDIPALCSALLLAVGIGIQNFPEGTAVALPMKSVHQSNFKAFLCGMQSGIAEPIFAVLGYFTASFITPVQPFLLAFSAGAMLFVTARDLLPDACKESEDCCAWGYIIGFLTMMALDVFFA